MAKVEIGNYKIIPPKNNKITIEGKSKENNNKYIKNMIKNIKNEIKYDRIYKKIKINNESTNKNNNIKNNQNVIISRKATTLKIAPTKMTNNEYKLIMVQREKMKKILNYNPKNSIKLDNIGTISYASYFESDILKLLSYLNQFNINDIKIVAHSALMKTFLNQKIIGDKKNIDDELKIVEKKENMWSIILNEGKICITRHAFTIANLFKEEGKKMNQFADKDTKLSLYGILGALDFNNPSINLTNCNNTVFVSILVRTWITALCLYLPKIQINKNNQENKFTLVVSPFIKEATKYIGIIRNTDDNLPIPINKQIIIIKNFLKFLREKISSNSESPLEQYIQSSNIIRDFFDSKGILEIYCVKEMKDKKFKYVKYEISYDTNNNCYVSTNKKENYFGSIAELKPLQESIPTCSSIFGCKKKSEELEIRKLQILPGVRKPEIGLNISKEPLSKIKVNNFKNCISDIKIGIIDIDEEREEPFTKEQIEKFYNENKKLFKDSNILVVCTQRSSSLGTTNHFQHLLKVVLEEQTNTNFNFKNKNKHNTTQVIPLKSFSAISGSKKGLRTRVYTQGLDNDKLDVKFNSVDFRYRSNIFLSTSSNQGAILCTIKYDDIDLVVQDNSLQNNNIIPVENNKELKVLNSFIDNGNPVDIIVDEYFKNSTYNKRIKFSDDTVYTGKLKFSNFFSNNIKQPVLKNITYKKFNNVLELIQS